MDHSIHTHSWIFLNALSKKEDKKKGRNEVGRGTHCGKRGQFEEENSIDMITFRYVHVWNPYKQKNYN